MSNSPTAITNTIPTEPIATKVENFTLLIRLKGSRNRGLRTENIRKITAKIKGRPI
jgi:hypothetical protein